MTNTPRLNRVLARAQELAESLNHTVVGTEVVMLALLDEQEQHPDGNVFRMFEHFKAPTNSMRHWLHETMVPSVIQPTENQKLAAKLREFADELEVKV